MYIGRAHGGRGRGSSFKSSVWHNPFEIGKDGEREEVIEKYERYLLDERPDLVERLPELKGKALACWCAPELCHGDVLARLADES